MRSVCVLWQFSAASLVSFAWAVMWMTLQYFSFEIHLKVFVFFLKCESFLLKHCHAFISPVTSMWCDKIRTSLYSFRNSFIHAAPESSRSCPVFVCYCCIREFIIRALGEHILFANAKLCRNAPCCFSYLLWLPGLTISWLRSTVGGTPVLGRRTDPVLRSTFRGRVTTMWVNRPLKISQLGQLSLSSFRGR